MEIIIQILNILVIVIACLVYSFLNKKAENFATKKDIADITEKIEEVKIIFASQKHLLSKKRETYEKIINSMRIFIEGHGATEERKDYMLEVYSLAWLWANDEVLKKINVHIDLQIKKSSAPNFVGQDDLKKTYVDVILEMRKDSGYPSTKLTIKDFQFINFKT